MRARAVYVRVDGHELAGPWVPVTPQDMAGPHTPQLGGSVDELAGFTGWRGLRERVPRMGQADEIKSARAEWDGPVTLAPVIVESPKPVTLFEASVLGRRAVSRLMVQVRAALQPLGPL